MYHCVDGSFSPPQNDAFGRCCLSRGSEPFMTYVTSSEITVATFCVLRVFFPQRMTTLHGSPVRAQRSSLTPTLFSPKVIGGTVCLQFAVDPFPPDSNLFALACNYRWSNWPRHEVSSWRLPVAYVRNGMPAFLRRIQVGVVPDDRNIQLERLNSGSQTIGRNRALPGVAQRQVSPGHHAPCCAPPIA